MRRPPQWQPDTLEPLLDHSDVFALPDDLRIRPFDAGTNDRSLFSPSIPPDSRVGGRSQTVGEVGVRPWEIGVREVGEGGRGLYRDSSPNGVRSGLGGVLVGPGRSQVHGGHSSRPVVAGSRMRQPDLDAVPGSNRQQLLDLFLGGRQGGRRSFGDRHADLEEHLLQAGRGDRDQHLGRSVRSRS